MTLTRQQCRQLRKESVVKPFTNKVRQSRELLEMTQVQLAEAIGTAQARVSEIENAGNSENLTVGTVRMYAEFFGCSIEDLVPKPDWSAR